MTPPAKPRPTPDILESQEARNRYDAAIDGWGEAMARQFGRLCRKAREVGAAAPGLECPPAER